jgi:hypothetical protein
LVRALALGFGCFGSRVSIAAARERVNERRQLLDQRGGASFVDQVEERR